MTLRSEILVGDSRALLKEIPDQSFQMCVTSPPYWGLRRYIPDGSVRLRADLTPDELAYVISELRKAGLL